MATKATKKALEPVNPEEVGRPADVPEVGPQEMYSQEELRNLQTFEDFVDAVENQFGVVVEASHVIGDGFALLRAEDKRLLVGVTLVFLDWRFYKGDYGSNFVAVRIGARNRDGTMAKYIINDGSTGLCDMLARYSGETGRFGGLLVRHGLTASEYIYCERCRRVVNPEVDAEHLADHKKSVTYYIDTSA